MHAVTWLWATCTATSIVDAADSATAAAQPIIVFVVYRIVDFRSFTAIEGIYGTGIAIKVAIAGQAVIFDGFADAILIRLVVAEVVAVVVVRVASAEARHSEWQNGAAHNRSDHENPWTLHDAPPGF